MLKGKLIQLRAVEPSDLELHYQWENNTNYWSISNTIIPFSKETLKNYLSSVKDLMTDKQFRFVIETPDGNAVGFIDLFEFDPIHKRAGIGILIGDVNARQKGFAADALDVLIHYCQKKLQLRHLFCHILAENTASIKLFTNKNFKQNGIKTQWHWNGEKYEDELFFQLPLYV